MSFSDLIRNAICESLRTDGFRAIITPIAIEVDLKNGMAHVNFWRERLVVYASDGGDSKLLLAVEISEPKSFGMLTDVLRKFEQH
jgi:hypothetical protein